jgi:hypothetical protein
MSGSSQLERRIPIAANFPETGRQPKTFFTKAIDFN